jgi:hypothetical protein
MLRARFLTRSIAGPLLFLLLQAPASARSVAELLSQRPEVILSTKRPFYDVERCIVMGVSPTIPPYRTPERPFDTLFLSRDFAGTILWRLEQSADGLVELRAYSASRLLSKEVRGCFI